MIYIVTLVVILLLVYQFDIVGKTQNKLLYYNMLMCWLTAISAFQYCVGSDTPIYMYEHDVYSWKDFTWDYIFSFPKRQPGWVLLSLMGKLFSDDYFVIKLFQAIIVNVAIFKFFRKQSKAIFTCIFFYFIMLYLDFSFNIMRASIAIAIFLLGYLYFI